MSTVDLKVVSRTDKEYEQIVYAEVLVPDTLNAYNDYSTAEHVRSMAYEFARQGYGVDVDHDKVDVAGQKCYVVESFIAREGDPDFIVGSWVVGVKITDDDLWARVLSGEINGFSYDATVLFNEATFTVGGNRTIIGITEPDLFDGHTHAYTVVIDGAGNVVAGGTSITDGHMHVITTHTVTDSANGHTHRYQAVEES